MKKTIVRDINVDESKDSKSKKSQKKSSKNTDTKDSSLNTGSSDGFFSGDYPMKHVAVIFVSVVIVGILSGFGISYATTGTTSQVKTTKSGEKTLSGKDDVAESAGIADKETFSDSAEGTLEDKTEDDPDEGSFKLIRPGGESQTVYLTSSTVDMTEFVGKEVRIYGETFSSEKVGWLMDVGFVEVIK